MNEKYPRGIEVTAGIIPINDNGEILVCFSPKWDKLGFPGGHVDTGEKMEDACIREAKEEMGVDIEVIRLLTAKEYFLEPPTFKRNAHFVCFDFLVKIKPGQEIKVDHNEITEFKWVSLEDAINMVGDDFKPPLKQLLNESK